MDRLQVVVVFLQLLAPLIAVLEPTTPPPTPRGQYTHGTWLDKAEKFYLFWKFDQNTITFESHVNAKGYVAIGLSPKGGMEGADIAIGWVNNKGESVFQDMYSVAYEMPRLDESQDWHLLFAEEKNGVTVLQYTRKLDTGDCHRDMAITEDTMRVIWAYTDVDPLSPDKIKYHHNNRGVKSIVLLSSPDAQPRPFPDDAVFWDFFNPNVTILPQRKFYWCQHFRVPATNLKQHVIQYSTIITPRNEPYVHHMGLYACPRVLPHYALEGYDCSENRSKEGNECMHVMTVWTIGSGPTVFPEHVGFPMGTEDDPLYLMMETHYDNYDLRSDLVDSSGIQMVLTPTLRKYDAGLLRTGELGMTILVPPHVARFPIIGLCHASCTEEVLREHPEGVRVFSAVPHAHLMARTMLVRHVRDGVELENIMRDDHYDFNLQEARMLKRERVILPGDDIIVECGYSSLDRTNISVGGRASTDEMCQSYLYYYPRLNWSYCESTLNPLHMLMVFPEAAAQMKNPGLEWMKPFSEANWTETMSDQLASVSHTGERIIRCGTTVEESPYKVQWQPRLFPLISRPLQSKTKHCSIQP